MPNFCRLSNFLFTVTQPSRNCHDSYLKSTDLLKFIYSEKAIKYCKISIIDLTVTTQDKSTLEISQNFVSLSECMNFIQQNIRSLGIYFVSHVIFSSYTYVILFRINIRIILWFAKWTEQSRIGQKIEKRKSLNDDSQNKQLSAV